MILDKSVLPTNVKRTRPSLELGFSWPLLAVLILFSPQESLRMIFDRTLVTFWIRLRFFAWHDINNCNEVTLTDSFLPYGSASPYFHPLLPRILCLSPTSFWHLPASVRLSLVHIISQIVIESDRMTIVMRIKWLTWCLSSSKIS